MSAPVDRLLPTALNSTPILCLHGLGSRGSDWDGMLGALCQGGRPGLAPDLLGHGREPSTATRLSIEDQADHVTRWLEARGAPARIHGIGISLGAMVALELAARTPQRWASLTLMSPTPDTRLRSLGACGLYLMRRLAFECLSSDRHARWLAGRLFPGLGQAALRQQFRERWREIDPAGYRASLRGSVGWTITGRESRIACPTLLLRGTRDFFPARAAKALATRLPSATLEEFEGLGHAFLVEAPERVVPRVAAFLASVEATADPSS